MYIKFKTFLHNYRWDEEGVPYLLIDCVYSDNLSTNISIPRRLFNTFDIEYIKLDLSFNNITKIPSPAINKQLAKKLRFLNLDKNSISQIDPGAFNGLPMLETLIMSTCTLDNDVIRPEFVFLFI
jgi:hypothetical protein